jgi:hypothetical protein
VSGTFDGGPFRVFVEVGCSRIDLFHLSDLAVV